MIRTLRSALAAPLLVVLLVSGCQDKPAAAPQPVPTALAPKSVLGGSLGFYLNTAPGTQVAFRQNAHDSLIDQGQLWEIRRKDRLIGTLEIATVKADVNLSKQSVRDQFTSPILVGARNDIRVLGQEVDLVQAEGGLTTMVWFGKGLFLVLQDKDQVVSGADLAQAIIEYQQSRPEWSPLAGLYSPT